MKVFTKPVGVTLKRRVISGRQAATSGRSEDVISAYEAFRPEVQATFRSRHVGVERTQAFHCAIARRAGYDHLEQSTISLSVSALARRATIGVAAGLMSLTT